MKAYRLLIILLVIIIAIPFAGRLFWLMKKSKPIDIVIINKSVQKSSQNELKALNWVLNYEKFVDSSRDFYDYEYDYMGYFPDAVTNDRKIETYKLEDVPSLAESFDALIFIDITGVDLTQELKKTFKRKYYGGFNQNDYYLLKEMTGKQKLVIAEYNFFGPPTEELVRYNTEQFLDIYTLGWTGKYFNNLSKEKISELIPAKWFDLYKQNYSSEWNFSGPGIVIANLEQNRIIVLPAEKYMTSKYPNVQTSSEIAEEYNIPEMAAYSGWFDISYQGKNKVISRFNLNLNKEGAEMLRKNGIEPEFPAVIESGNKKFYYMAGDFSKGHVFIPFSRFGFISTLIRNRESGKPQNPEKFIMVYYDRLLADILNEYYTEISGFQK